MTSDEQSAASVSTPPSVVDRLAHPALRNHPGSARRHHPAGLIRDTLLGKPHRDDKKPVIALGDIDPRELRITNAVISGPLDLNNTHIRPTVEITQSQLTDHMTLQNANLDHDLNLESCSLPSLDMIGAHIAGELVMIGAHITGELVMTSAQLTGTNQGGDSLNSTATACRWTAMCSWTAGSPLPAPSG